MGHRRRPIRTVRPRRGVKAGMRLHPIRPRPDARPCGGKEGAEQVVRTAHDLASPEARGDARVLEVGPGTGCFALRTAGLAWRHTPQILDPRRGMPDLAMRGARGMGTQNAVPLPARRPGTAAPGRHLRRSLPARDAGSASPIGDALEELGRVPRGLAVGEGHPAPTRGRAPNPAGIGGGGGSRFRAPDRRTSGLLCQLRDLVTTPSSKGTAHGKARRQTENRRSASEPAPAAGRCYRHRCHG